MFGSCAEGEEEEKGGEGKNEEGEEEDEWRRRQVKRTEKMKRRRQMWRRRRRLGTRWRSRKGENIDERELGVRNEQHFQEAEFSSCRETTL